VIDSDRPFGILTDEQYQIVWQRILRRLLIMQISATEWFFRFDLDKDCRWTRGEARAALASMPIGLSANEVEQVIERMDTRKSNMLTVDDVNAAIAEGSKAAPLEQWVRDVYRRIADSLAAQRVSPEAAFDSIAAGRRAQKREFFALATSLDIGLRPEQLEWLWKLSDINSDGLLDYSEFAARLRESQNIGTTAFPLPRPTDAERGLKPIFGLPSGSAPGSAMPEAWMELCLARLLMHCRRAGWATVDKMVDKLGVREDRTVSRAELFAWCQLAKAQLSEWEVDHVFMRLADGRNVVDPRAVRQALMLCDISDSPSQTARRRAIECLGQIRLGLMRKDQGGVAGATASLDNIKGFATRLRALFRELAIQKDILVVGRSEFLAGAALLASDIGETRLQELWYYAPKLRDNTLDIDAFGAALFDTPLPGESGVDMLSDDHYALVRAP
jgi:Ca2+-binding EF-hand superfamily protein